MKYINNNKELLSSSKEELNSFIDFLFFKNQNEEMNFVLGGFLKNVGKYNKKNIYKKFIKLYLTESEEIQLEKIINIFNKEKNEK